MIITEGPQFILELTLGVVRSVGLEKYIMGLEKCIMTVPTIIDSHRVFSLS